MSMSPSQGRRMPSLSDMASSDTSDAEKECAAGSRPSLSEMQSRSEMDREEGRTTDDEHTSSSDHVSLEGGSDTSRPGSGTWDTARVGPGRNTDAEPASWLHPNFAFTVPGSKQDMRPSSANTQQQLKLARLLLSRGKVQARVPS